jgi:hypothetical protein
MPIGAPRIIARPFAAVNQQAIAPSGTSPEAIWHQAYDTQTYTSASTTTLDFFAAINADKSLSNMEAAGQFPAPQVFELYNICLDLWGATAPLVSTTADTTGTANDNALLLFLGRPVWKFTLQNKTYGPYKLTTLHGTGGPQVFFAGTTAAGASTQFAKNDPSSGWNYNKSITIPAQTSFQFNISWSAAQTLTKNYLLCVSLFGVLSRAVK